MPGTTDTQRVSRSISSAEGKRPHRRPALIGAALAAVLILAACTGSVQPARLARGDSALPADFQISAYQREDLLGGEVVLFSELLTQGKPVVLNMWAGLCPPCRLEMPDFQEAHDEFQDRVLILGLDVGPFTGLGSAEDGRALLQELGITYPAGTISDPEVVSAYELMGMPSTYFIKPDGQVARRWTGLLTKAKLTELIEEHLTPA